MRILDRLGLPTDAVLRRTLLAGAALRRLNGALIASYAAWGVYYAFEVTAVLTARA